MLIKGKPKIHGLTPSSLRSGDYDNWNSRFMLRVDQDDFSTGYSKTWRQKGWFKLSFIPISIILLLNILPLLDAAEKHNRTSELDFTSNPRQKNCVFSLVETIPEGLSYRNGTTPYPSTFDVWKGMILNATDTIEIASFYWTLRDEDKVSKYPGSDKGEEIFAALLQAGTERKLKLKIAQSQPDNSDQGIDTQILSRIGAAEVRNVNMLKLIGDGGGILHTKLWIVDRKHAYIGSANIDWRSLSQVKEMGIYITNCPCLIKDIGKIFDVYWAMGLPDATVPPSWPEELSTVFNKKTPMKIFLNKTKSSVYISSSPPEFCPAGRENDLDSILSVIQKAKKFIYIAVMDYEPLILYTGKPKFWPIIDDALKTAAIDHRVEVRILVSSWNYTKKTEHLFVRSLVDISNAYKGVKVDARTFVVPSSAAQSQIPFARVNHNKYMVTDKAAYIGTSNWSGDYFTDTTGVGVIIEGDTFIRRDLKSVFLRDWNSEFSYPLSKLTN